MIPNIGVTDFIGNRVVDSPPDLLGDTILAAAATSVSFVVPKGYDILLLSWHDVNGDHIAWTQLQLTFNGDTAGNYDETRQNFGTASSTTNAASEVTIGFCGDTDGTLSHTNGFVTIFNRATQEKVVIGTEVLVDKSVGAAAEDFTGAHLEGKWRNTSDEIANITISASVGNFTTGSRFILRGIKSKDGR